MTSKTAACTELIDAAGTGKIVEEMVNKKPVSVNMEAFSIERFN